MNIFHRVKPRKQETGRPKQDRNLLLSNKKKCIQIIKNPRQNRLNPGIALYLKSSNSFMVPV